MGQIINDLFYGGIQPYQKEYYCEHKERMKYIEKDLIKTLNDKQKELLDSYKIACGNHESKIAYKNFSYGFKLASKMIFEALK